MFNNTEGFILFYFFFILPEGMTNPVAWYARAF